MSRYRHALPQLGKGLFLTDGGLETTLIFLDGIELSDFAAFDVLRQSGGRECLLHYYQTYAAIAEDFKTHLILESPTWRASPDWGRRLGYSGTQLAEANRASIAMLEQIREATQSDACQVVISGCLGPRGDGYQPDHQMSADHAWDYHNHQIRVFANSAADMLCAITMNYVEEAIGIVLAARQVKMPVAVSFTVETDGHLPTGQSLQSAIEQTDSATSKYPAYYMINCAHPTHFESALASGGAWLERIRGMRANASCKSHAELDAATELDSGNPRELGRQYAQLKSRYLPRLSVLGGCCGTDQRHLREIARACRPLFNGAG